MLRQKSGASTPVTVQTLKKSLTKSLWRQTAQGRHDWRGPAAVTAAACHSKKTGAQQHHSGCLQMDTSPSPLLTCSSWLFFPAKVFNLETEAPDGHYRDGLAILGGGPAAPALPVLLIDWWWSGGCFLFIRGRESGTTAVVLPRTQAAPELNNAPSLSRGATNPSVILLLLFPNELN